MNTQSDRSSGSAATVVTIPLRGAIGLPVRIFVTTFASAIIALMAGRTGRSRLEVILFLGVAAVVLIGGLLHTYRHWNPRVVVGGDGLSIQIAGTTRFVPYQEIQSVERIQQSIHPQAAPIDCIALAKRSEERFVLPFVGQSEALINYFLARAHQGIAAATAARVRVAVGREGRSAALWKEALRKRVGDGGFREMGLSVDELAEVLCQPTASVEQRIGAALALRAVNAEHADERIRVAAANTAGERIRVALMAVADDSLEDEALEAAIAEESGGAE